ncbi:hypothetical protein V8E54_006819 [Elaphomyces granulatus]
MLFPFLGLFVSLAIWGTFYPVPGFIRPSDGFVRRIFGAFEAAACAGEIYCAIEVVRVYAGPWHRDSASHVREVTFGGFEEYICLLNGTEVKTSVAIQLGDETVVEQPVVDGGNCTDLVVAIGNDEEWLVETGYTGGDSPVFTSPVSPQAAGWAFAWCLVVLLCFCVGLVPYVAHTLSDAIERLGRYLEPSPKVARLLVVDCGSSSPDLLSSSYTSSGPSAFPLEREADDVFIHHMVEEAISRLELQRLVAVSPELQCILKGWTLRPRGAVDTLTNPVPVVSPVAANQSPAHQPWQRWALVVYRPGDHNVVYHNVCILLARWRQTVEMAVPVTDEQREETVPAIEDTAAPEEPPQRRNRTGQKHRKRRGKRREREEREREEREREEPCPGL